MRQYTNSPLKNQNTFSARHYSMTKLCRALFEYENKIKLVEKINAQLGSQLK